MKNRLGSLQKIAKGHLSGFNKVKGDYGENFIAYELLKRNFECSKNLLEDHVDLFIRIIGGYIKTIQVKTSSINEKTGSASCFIGDEEYRKKIDYFALVLLDDDMLTCNCYYFLPSHLFNKSKSKHILISPNSSKYKRFKNEIKIY